MPGCHREEFYKKSSISPEGRGREPVDIFDCMLNDSATHLSRRIVSVIALDGRTEADLLRLLTAAPDFARLERLEASTPAGLSGSLDGQSIAIGNAPYFAALGLSTGQLNDWPERLHTRGEQVLFVAVNGLTVGVLGIEP
jgi:cation transport ATPase